MATVKTLALEIFDGETAFRKVKALNARREVKAVLSHAAKQGFTPSTSPKDVQGFKRTYTPEGKVEKDGVVVTRLDISYHVQELKKVGSKDTAAMVVLTSKANGAEGQFATDVRFLVAPGGNIEKIVEMKFDPSTARVVPTNSWFTRLKNCIRGKCGSACKDALTGCLGAGAGGIVAYLGCLAVKCGGCSARCVACATCNCRFWCRWATGCCEG